MTRAEKLKNWTKQFITQKNGLHAVGFDCRGGWISVEFMNNDKGVWVILCRYAYYPDGREGINLGTYKSIRRVKRLLKVLGVGDYKIYRKQL